MKEIMPSIGIVTVLYNSETVLNGFYESLNNQTYKNFVVYAVDNNSSDNSVSLTKKLSENSVFRTVLIEENQNWGVAKGNNIGIKKALADKCDYILLANNDIEFSSETIEVLFSELQSYQASMAVPKILYHGTDLLWCAGGEFLWSGGTLHYGQLIKDDGAFNTTKFVDYSPTCFMLIEKKVFETVGVMDENFFVYFDDTDFVWRAVKKAGLKLLYASVPVVYHKVSACTTSDGGGFKFHYMTRNLAYFSKKNFSRPRLFFVLLYNIARYLCSLFKHPSKPSIFSYVRYIVEGLRL